MKNTFTIEELKYNLPDYVTKNIEDKDLILEIEKELACNLEFKKEYDEMKRTVQFLDTTELESPSESYFANLSAKINDRIEQSANKKKISYWEKLNLVWRIAIPVIPIIIIGIILFNLFKDENRKQSLTSETKKIDTIEKKDEVVKKTDEPLNKELQEINNLKVSNDGNKKKNLITNSNKHLRNYSEKNKIKNNIESTNKPGNTIQEIPDNLLADNIDKEVDEEIEAEESENNLFYSTEDERENLENEFQDLTPEEQQEIINNLNKTQI